jgi:hypothetical protein
MSVVPSHLERRLRFERLQDPPHRLPGGIGPILARRYFWL